ncbi:unnamed protein product [Prunus armeniaca]|uniref:IBB domain-containing protein n=1 Tax=Prunus armeniaca TaxID=36596 RepID=A0A6J5VBI4_PRUAR|nr:unnamed protein product [Prunus armeniaca]
MSLRPSTTTVVRKKSYKTGVEIRKNKREDNLLKKRREGLAPSQQQLLDGTQTTVVFQKTVVWALGNVAGDSPSCRDLVLGQGAGDSPSCRDLVLGQGALMPLLAQLNEHSKLSMVGNATWTLSNFCRGKPATPFDQVKPDLPILRQLIYLNDEEVLTDACWALSYLSDGPHDKIQTVIEAGVCQRLVDLLIHPSPTVLIPALRTVVNIVTGDDSQTQVVWALGNVAGDSPSCRDLVLGQGALMPLLAQLNEHSKLSMVGNATWTLSNFCRGKPATPFDQVKPDLPILRQLIYLNDEEVLTDACWALSYLSDGPNDKIQAVIEAGVCQRLVDLLIHLASRGCIKPLCDLLICPDPRIITVCLEGPENILKVGEADKEMGMNDGINLYAQLVDECEGLDKIDNLQTHDNSEIYEKAVKILERDWAEEEEFEASTLMSGWKVGWNGVGKDPFVCRVRHSGVRVKTKSNQCTGFVNGSGASHASKYLDGCNLEVQVSNELLQHVIRALLYATLFDESSGGYVRVFEVLKQGGYEIVYNRPVLRALLYHYDALASYLSKSLFFLFDKLDYNYTHDINVKVHEGFQRQFDEEYKKNVVITQGQTYTVRLVHFKDPIDELYERLERKNSQRVVLPEVRYLSSVRIEEIGEAPILCGKITQELVRNLQEI